MRLVSIHKLMLIFALLLFKILSSNAQVWTLEQCIDSAQVHNKNLQISKNNIGIGEQRSKEAKANLIPKVTANADYKYFSNLPYQLMPLSTFNPLAPEGQYKETQFGVPHNINANLQLAMPLYNPQLYGAIQATKVASELTELQFQKTEEQIFFEISNLYYNAQIIHHQLAFIDSNLINSKRLLKTIQLLNEQLLAKSVDVDKIQLQVAQLSAQKESIISKNIQVLNALKFTMGVSIEHDLQIESEIQYQNTPEYSPLVSLDAQIITTQNKILSSELNTLNKSRIIPSINLIGMYGTTGFGYDQKPNDFLRFYPIGFAGVQASYPLFNGTQTIRKINQKKLELQNNQLQSDLIKDQNSMQLINAKLQNKITEKAVKTTSEQVKLAQTIYDQTTLQQKQGTATLTDILLADNTLRETQQTYLATIIDYLKSDLELKKLTGNLQSIKK